MTSGYIQCFCLYLNQQTAASNAWTFCVRTRGARTNTTSILSYSFSHSVELPLGFTGVVLYLHHQCETFTPNSLDTVHYYISVYLCKSSACTLLWFVLFFFNDSEIMFFFSFVLTCFSPRQHMYMILCTIQTHAFHLSPKVWSTTFSKKLPVPKNNLAAPWLASLMQPLGKLSD